MILVRGDHVLLVQISAHDADAVTNAFASDFDFEVGAFVANVVHLGE